MYYVTAKMSSVEVGHLESLVINTFQLKSLVYRHHCGYCHVTP